MIASQKSSGFKESQDKYIRQNKAFLEKKGSSVKSIKSKISPQNPAKDDQKPKMDLKTSSEKLESLADKVSQPLLTMTTIPLLELFPTTITLDLRKITINTMTFYKSHSIQTITYDYLKEVGLESGLISSSLRLVLVGNSMNPLLLPNFKKRQASRAKKIILGMMQCQKHLIKPDELDPQRDIEKIITLGSAASS